MIPSPDSISLSYGEWKLLGTREGWHGWHMHDFLCSPDATNNERMFAPASSLEDVASRMYARAEIHSATKRSPHREDWERMAVALDVLLEAGWNLDTPRRTHESP